ncbi:hypothetical protein BDR07DRAFT_909501 [Suillus spraguei]|nr:hypothetical protein BDR07DRAFT_909501 [Suillus spraguei]
MLFEPFALLAAFAPTLLLASPLPNRVVGVTAVVDNAANNFHVSSRAIGVVAKANVESPGGRVPITLADIEALSLDEKAKANDGGSSSTGVPEKINMEDFHSVGIQDIVILAKHPQGPSYKP